MSWVFLPAGSAFIITLLLGPATIEFLRRLRWGQHVREVGPKRHLGKAGTPTMGGVLMIAAVTAATAVFVPEFTQTPYALAVMIGYGLVGLVDDGLKVIGKRSLGLRAREKLLAQVILAGFMAAYGLANVELATSLRIPFSPDPWVLPAWAYTAVTVGAIVGAANAVNLTDGLDGLAAGSVAVSAFAFAAIAAMVGAPEAAVLGAAIGGACLGFAWFNAHPAQVFMGDTGSLALGAGLAIISVLTRTQLFLVIIGGLFVLETLSVVLQVAYFRLTGGRRLLRMSPLHHHFELLGWTEPQVVIRFWLIAIVCGAAGVMALHASL